MLLHLTIAFALFLVLEGIVPFINPALFRKSMQQIATLPDNVLRYGGLSCMLIGLVLLYIVN